MALVVAALVLLVVAWAISRTQSPRHANVETTIDPVAEWRLPAAGGGPVELEWSFDGTRLLVMERGDGLKAHVLDRELGDQGALVPIESAWTPRGASWSLSDRWVLVWGSARTGGDILVAWNASTRDGTGSPLPSPGELGLPRIDAAALLANDMILIVAGRDENGTSRLRVYELASELAPFRLHRDHAYPGNATVLSIRGIYRDVVCLDSSGCVVIYDSMDWMQDWAGRVIMGTPTSWCMEMGYQFLFGDGEGRLRYFVSYDRYVAQNVSVDGPVRGAAFTYDECSANVVAVGGPQGPSQLQVWYMGGNGVVRPRRSISWSANGTVTWVAGHPAFPNIVVVALLDGTVRSYQVDIATIPGAERSFLDRSLPWLQVPFGALLLAAAVLWWRDHRRIAALPPEGEERLRPRLSHRRR